MFRVGNFSTWRRVAAAALILLLLAGEIAAADWRTASREPAGLAPDPATTPEAVIQVYAARTIGWRGYFGVHSWIAVKPAGGTAFTVYELMGYQTRRTGNGVRISQRHADGYWYGNRPHVVADVRGPGAEPLIERIRAAADDYPYGGVYHVWPGPNSNTFIAHLLRAVPELRADLPAHAVGKDYLGPGLAATTPGGTGVQFNLFGVLGLAIGWEEGVELNVIGLNFGLSPKRLALKLPGIGNVGLIDQAQPRLLAAPKSARLSGSAVSRSDSTR
jgi:hypothetical protein